MAQFDTSTAERNTLGHGYAFARLFGHCVRYSYVEDAWYVFDGRSWVKDKGDIMAALGMQARARYLADATRLKRAAAAMADEDDAERQLRTARIQAAERFHDHIAQTLGTPKALSMMILAARSTMGSDGTPLSLAIDPDVFDRRKHLLCVQNCVIDLRTGRALPHDPRQMIAKIAPSVFDPGATAPGFLRAVRQMMCGDERRVRFLQRILGYLLTGEAGERKVIVFHGKKGNNGKSTIANILKTLLGSMLASGLPVATLLEKRFGADEIDVGLMSINGKRVVIAVEPNKGARFATGVVKALSGNDLDGVTARRPHQRELAGIKPGAKILLITNHLPTWEDDQAYNERFLIIPFDAEFVGDAEHRDLAEALLAEEAPGILAWLVEGARLYYRESLAVPPDVQAAAAKRRRDGDLVARWFDECCVREATAATPVLALHQSYVGYVRDAEPERTGDVDSVKAFSESLARLGLKRSRQRPPGRPNPVKTVRGVRLREHMTEAGHFGTVRSA